MKDELRRLVTEALRSLSDPPLPEPIDLDCISLARCHDPSQGDYACNIALRLAKPARRSARELAEAIVAALPPSPLLAASEVAGPGFINFRLVRSAQGTVLSRVIEQREHFGESHWGHGQRVLVEFVSANPTGPLHVSHGRQAAYGAALANLLQATGHDVQREYYVNAAGRQTDARAAMLGEIRNDLAAFGVRFDRWYSEGELADSGAVQRAAGFAPAIAYHLQKRERGFTRIIDVRGADYHGCLAHVRGALVAMGEPSDCLEAYLIQFVSLFRGTEKIPMGRREAPFVTLRQLREEVGNDACKLFYLMRSHEQPLVFDLQLARSRTHDNPLYYIQYAHARVASVMKQSAARQLRYTLPAVEELSQRLEGAHEEALLRELARYPEVVSEAAAARAPHRLVHQLHDLANAFHNWYNAATLLADDAAVRNARLTLALAAQQVLRNGLGLLGVSAPESM